MTAPDQPFSPAPHPPPHPAAHPPLRWQVVLPIKGTPDAKSRLAVGAGVSRLDLARAMALDTLTATLACPLVATVLVVTSDEQVRAEAIAVGALVEADPGGGLNAAIRRGAQRLADLRPDGDTGPVAALLADLPALTPADLDVALTACAAYGAEFGAAYVPDTEGTGTVLLTAVSAAALQPDFGDGSAARHAGVATRLDLDLPRLRRDVDVQVTLREALALGVGPRTTATLADADLRWLT